MVELILMVFKNVNLNYPIRSVPDDVLRVASQADPKCWMGRMMTAS